MSRRFRLNAVCRVSYSTSILSRSGDAYVFLMISRNIVKTGKVAVPLCLCREYNFCEDVHVIAVLIREVGSFDNNKGSIFLSLSERCVIVKLNSVSVWESEVMSYGERKAKREQEIEGLKEALTILSGEALLQASALFWGRS